MDATKLMSVAESYRMALEDPMRAVNRVDKVILPEIFADVIKNAENAARAAHDKWYKDAATRGVTRESNPNFVEYDELPEETKDANVAVALRTYRIFCYFGVEFTKTPVEVDQEKLEDLVYMTTTVVHDGWSKDKFAAGWRWAPERDNEAKLHTDLLDLEMLLLIWPGKDEWDRNAVRGSLESLNNDYGIYPIL